MDMSKFLLICPLSWLRKPEPAQPPLQINFPVQFECFDGVMAVNSCFPDNQLISYKFGLNRQNRIGGLENSYTYLELLLEPDS